jgi:MbtH protein
MSRPVSGASTFKEMLMSPQNSTPTPQQQADPQDELTPAADGSVEAPHAATGLDDAEGLFHVLVNAEEQYSLWPGAVPVPRGWDMVLESAPRAQCLAHIEAAWTDLRPLSLRQASGTTAG